MCNVINAVKFYTYGTYVQHVVNNIHPSMCCFNVSLDTHPTILVVGLVEVPLESPFKNFFWRKTVLFHSTNGTKMKNFNLRARYVTRPQCLSVATWLYGFHGLFRVWNLITWKRNRRSFCKPSEQFLTNLVTSDDCKTSSVCGSRNILPVWRHQKIVRAGVVNNEAQQPYVVIRR